MSVQLINTYLSIPLAEHVARMVGEKGFYETPDEYVRDLIRRDMERLGAEHFGEAIVQGYSDIEEGAMFASTGDFTKDMAILEKKEAEGWK